MTSIISTIRIQKGKVKPKFNVLFLTNNQTFKTTLYLTLFELTLNQKPYIANT